MDSLRSRRNSGDTAEGEIGRIPLVQSVSKSPLPRPLVKQNGKKKASDEYSVKQVSYVALLCFCFGGLVVFLILQNGRYIRWLTIRNCNDVMSVIETRQQTRALFQAHPFYDQMLISWYSTTVSSGWFTFVILIFAVTWFAITFQINFFVQSSLLFALERIDE
jgi:hypothetical protein